MPHESTVAHEQRFVMETPMISRTRTFKLMDEEEEHNRLVAVSIIFFIRMLYTYIPSQKWLQWKFWILSKGVKTEKKINYMEDVKNS